MKIAKETLLGYVVKYWKPTVQQVKDWMDSFWHKDEMIPVAKIDGLQEIINALPTEATLNTLLNQLLPFSITLTGAGNYYLGPGKILDLIRVESALGQTLHVQDIATGDDLLGDIEVSAGVVRSVGCNIAAGESARQLFITGVTSPVTIRFYVR